jgi:hypothetical protein
MRWKALVICLALLSLVLPAVAAVYSPGDGAAKVWGYDLPYSYAYGAGVPFYVGHNNGEPSGTIYENPAGYPDNIPRPGVIYGDPENALITNFSYAYPSMTGLTYGGQFSPFSFVGLQPL